ncbi:serine--tRNA ligase [Planctomycetales bacterium ZRK34]|nr:serine--tRNA ligase [Planctomycetales bacterium ZRK34]
MIDLKDLRDNPNKYRDGQIAKNYDPTLVDRLLEYDESLRSAMHQREQLVAEKNKIGKEIGPLMGRMKKASDAEKAELESQVAALKQKSEQLKADEQQHIDTIAKLEPLRDALWLEVAQPPDPDVPRGQSADDNVEISRWNPDDFDTAKSFEDNRGFAPKSHIDLMTALGMVDFERGVKIAGSRSYILTGAGMQLHNAILRFAFDFMTMENGFTAASVPVLVRDSMMEGTGFFPHGKDQAYEIANPTGEGYNLYLTGTGEVGLMGLHADEIVDADKLPLCYTTVSTCFRREAGSAGKDTAGLYRIHQFDKVEQVVICKADEAESRAWHKKMIGFVESMLQKLGLPYRLLQCCTGDLGPKNADMIDLECWMPSREGYGETHSASRLYDYQTRRLNIRYKDPETKKNTIAHSLNNTVAASPRILIPIIEMYQNADGSITVPPALRPYMGNIEKIG